MTRDVGDVRGGVSLRWEGVLNAGSMSMAYNIAMLVNRTACGVMLEWLRVASLLLTIN